ncbi:M50 family metallopeptidase [Dehalogenimonas sp. THU2]|uniref:M50 family metallopeptidase n=1 Tax=Dehalogenimonas sp. THU2 TaxID=3151121 RepID=UPI0032183925
MLFTLLAFMLVLGVLVLAHEAGHFFTAKAFGIKVNEFGIGYPPRLFAVKRGDTEYSVNALPLGGFVKLAGEEDPDVKNSLASKSHAKRIIVLASGAVINALLPIILFTGAFMVPHDVATGTVTVIEVAPNSPAAEAGVVAGDIIVSFDGRALTNNAELGRVIFLNLGQPAEMEVLRADGTTTTVTVTPRWEPPEGQGAVGLQTRTEDVVITEESEPFFSAVGLGFSESLDTLVLFKNSILSLITGTAEGGVAGPVGIAQLTGEVARAGLSPLMEFTALLSLNLAILNILPIPALDGGRIAFVVVEWARRGKRIDPQTEGKIHFIGFAILITLIVMVTFNDIMRIVGGG